MTIQDLIQQCEKAIASPISGGENAKVSFVLKGSFTQSGRKKFCQVKGAPMGQCLADVGEDGVLVLFNAHEVLKFLKDASEKERA